MELKQTETHATNNDPLPMATEPTNNLFEPRSTSRTTTNSTLTMGIEIGADLIE